MLFRISWQWKLIIACLAICGSLFGYNQIVATSVSKVSSKGIELTRKKPYPIVVPQIEPNTAQPWPGQWIEYPADDVLPHGLKIEVTAGVITSFATVAGDETKYDVLGSRYVVGDLDATDITPTLWRKFELEMPKPDGSLAEVTVLRPLWWVQENSAKVGGSIDLALQEAGLTGEARVLRGGRCNADSRTRDNGTELIIGKIKHHNAEVLDLVCNNDSSQTLGVTASHPIMSVDRNDWISAGDLNIHERVQTSDGTATLTGKTKRPTRETVFNIEVHRSHSYRVSQLGILAHNTPIWTCTKKLTGAQNAIGHFKKHGAEFPALHNATQYVAATRKFINTPPAGTLTKVRPNGDTVLYEPATNTFAIKDAAGVPRTMFKPDPAKHGFPTNLDYFNAQ